jgi:signal transduction histidine kinase
MQVWTELLGTKAHDPAFVLQCAGVLQRNIAAQSRLVDDLLEMSRLAFGKVHMREARVDVSDLLETELRTLEPTAAANGVHLRSRIAAGVSALNRMTHLGMPVSVKV